MMKLEISTRNMNNDDMVRRFIDRKLSAALRRIGQHVEHVAIRLEDKTARSVFDGVCRIEASLQPTGGVHVLAHGESAFDCVLRAVQKFENAMQHHISRHRLDAPVSVS